MSEWTGMELHPSLLTALASVGFTNPTDIQRGCILPAARDRRDVIGAAQTGSGKTLAFALPILQVLLQVSHRLTRGCCYCCCCDSACACPWFLYCLHTPPHPLLQKTDTLCNLIMQLRVSEMSRSKRLVTAAANRSETGRWRCQASVSQRTRRARSVPSFWRQPESWRCRCANRIVLSFKFKFSNIGVMATLEYLLHHNKRLTRSHNLEFSFVFNGIQSVGPVISHQSSHLISFCCTLKVLHAVLVSYVALFHVLLMLRRRFASTWRRWPSLVTCA